MSDTLISKVGLKQGIDRLLGIEVLLLELLTSSEDLLNDTENLTAVSSKVSEHVEKAIDLIGLASLDLNMALYSLNKADN